MTPKDWQQEVETAVGGLGLPWRVFASWIERDGETCCAELTDTRTGKERTIRLSRQAFATNADRRAEIVRQLQRVR